MPKIATSLTGKQVKAGKPERVGHIFDSWENWLVARMNAAYSF